MSSKGVNDLTTLHQGNSRGVNLPRKNVRIEDKAGVIRRLCLACAREGQEAAMAS